MVLGQKNAFLLSYKNNLFFGLNCSSFSLQLNAENRFKIRAVYNEIHIFKLSVCGLYGSDP